MLPVALPATEGENCTVNVAFCPPLTVTGVNKPLILKPVPVTLAAEIVTLVVLELVRVIVCVLLLPRTTEPKLILPGVAVSVALAATPLPVRLSV
jgi:hypothetical protein